MPRNLYQSQESQNGILTARQVALLLQVSESWVYKKCKSNILPHVKVGGIVRILEKNLYKWIEDHQVKGKLKV
jgi:excisionase family DNA binding protein